MLFNRVSILDVLADQKRQIKQKIQSLEQNYVLNSSESDLVAWLVSEFSLDVPAIDEPGIHVDYGEKQIDVSRDPMRMIMDRGRPFYVAGTQVTFIVPFTGDASYFDVQPQNFTYSTGRSSAVVAKNEIHFTYLGTNLDAERAKQEFQNELQLLKQNLQNLKTAADRRNGELGQEVREQVRQRKEKLLRDAQMAASMWLSNQAPRWSSHYIRCARSEAQTEDRKSSCAIRAVPAGAGTGNGRIREHSWHHSQYGSGNGAEP